MPDHTSNPACQRHRQPNVFNSSTSTPSPSNWKAEQPPHLTSNPISSPPPPRPPPNSPYAIDGSNGRSFRGSVPLPLKHDLNNQTIFPNKSNGPPRIPIERETRPLIVSAVNAVGIGGVLSTNGGWTSRRGRAGGMRGGRGGRERGNTSLGRESLGNGKTEEVGYALPPRTTIHNEQGPSLEETIGPASTKKRLEMMVEDTTTRPPSSHSLDWSEIEENDGHWEGGGENFVCDIQFILEDEASADHLLSHLAALKDHIRTNHTLRDASNPIPNRFHVHIPHNHSVPSRCCTSNN